MAVYTSSPTQQMQCIFTNIQNNPPHISLSLFLSESLRPPTFIISVNAKKKKTLRLWMVPESYGSGN